MFQVVRGMKWSSCSSKGSALLQDEIDACLGFEVINVLVGGWISGVVGESVFSTVLAITWFVLKSWDVLMSSDSSL